MTVQLLHYEHCWMFYFNYVECKFKWIYYKLPKLLRSFILTMWNVNCTFCGTMSKACMFYFNYVECKSDMALFCYLHLISFILTMWNVNR